MEFTVLLSEKRVQRHQVTAMHLTSGLAFLGAGAIISVYNFTIKSWGYALLAIALVLLGLTIGRNKWVIKPANNIIFRIIELLLAAIILSYSVFQQWKFPMVIFGFLVVALAFSIFWERESNASQWVKVAESGILLNVGSFKKTVQWVNIEQVLYRHGTLSVDCVDNTLYQWNIPVQKIDAFELEAFCAAQVELHRSQRKSEADW